MKNGDKSIYPHWPLAKPGENPVTEPQFLTKREYFAGLAMQGILASNPEYLHGNCPLGVPSEVAKLALQNADAQQFQRTKLGYIPKNQ